MLPNMSYKSIWTLQNTAHSNNISEGEGEVQVGWVVGWIGFSEIKANPVPAALSDWTEVGNKSCLCVCVFGGGGGGVPNMSHNYMASCFREKVTNACAKSVNKNVTFS